MAQFNQKDQIGGVSGSAPLPKKETPPRPPEKPMNVSPQDDPIAACAKGLYEEGLIHQEEQVQTKGRQVGYTEASLESVLQKRSGS